jgi:hypothetical protein
MTSDPSSSDDDLYALLGISSKVSSESRPGSHDTGLTRSPGSEAIQPSLDADTPVDSVIPTSPFLEAKRKHKRGISSRVRRSAERQLQRIPLEEDSDEPVKETVNTAPRPRADPTPTPRLELVKEEPPRSNPYWMYGQGLLIPPYNALSGKGNPEDKKEDVEVKEKDFADIHPDAGIKKEDSEDSIKEEKADQVVPRKQYKAADLLEQLIESIESSQSGQTTSISDIENHLSNKLYDDHETIYVKQEESVPMAKSPTSTTDEGLITADESFHTDTDIDTKPRRRFHVVTHQSRVKGSNRRRTRYQVVRHVPKSVELDEVVAEVEVKVEADPFPETPFQRDLQSTFSRSALLQIEELAKNDNTSGNRLPSHLRDLFPALSDKTSAITIANHLRKQLDLPLLSTKTDSIALIRAVAQMRLGIYTELVSALILPSAPEPAPDTDDEEKHEKKKKISLAPSALIHLHKALPAAFPDDKYAIKVFLGNHDPFGEMKGKVVWQDGIGTMVGGDPMGPGFRGKLSNEGLVHVFVDQYVLLLTSSCTLTYSSNVLHGLTQKFKHVKSVALPPPHLRTLSLPILSLLLRRGRPTPHGTLHLVASSPLYQNLDPLVRLGWEVSVLKRVEIYDDEVHDSHSAKLVSKSMNNLARVNAFHEGGSRRYKEQGVDEILHLKILQALNTKSNPAPTGSTIVLATGDAKGGQFNQDGFVGAVREAIKRGWMVELWSFSDGKSPFPRR